VIRGAASDVLSADVADRMVEEVLPNGSLAVVPQASHSVMTDNPEGMADAIRDFALG
jgi:pimeloyl-ACP methyl ester carboxylesterase